jgi:predicted RNA-binding protein associated with RNAse of E/G family
MLNEKKEIVQWYLDICYCHGVTENGVPWYKDLYLDIIIFPDHTWILVDEDELEGALQTGAITKREYDYAWFITGDLIKKLTTNRLYLMVNEDEIKIKR